MSGLTRCADVYVMLLNLAYEGGNIDLEELVVEPQKQQTTGQETLVKDTWAHSVAEDMERDMFILAKHYERKIERTRGQAVGEYHKSRC